MSELYEMYAKYKNFDFSSHHNEIVKNITNVKYSKGIGFRAGLYEPSFVMEMRVTNCSIGKEVKNIDGGYDYKYFFDEDGRIILSKQYWNRKSTYINFYFYSDNVCEYIHFDLSTKKMDVIAKVYYDELGRIIRYTELDRGYFGSFECADFQEHLFRYEGDKTYVTQKENGLTTEMMVKDNVLSYLDKDGKVEEFYYIRFKLVDGKKVTVPLPKKVPVFKIIKENMINVLTRWQNIDKSVIWILCESTDLVMQYTDLKEDCEEKWNIAFYESEEEEIFTDKNHIGVLENLLFNNGCNIDDLIDESDYFVDKMVKIIKELRKEGYITDDVAVVLSDLEISEKTLDIAKKINKKEIVKGLFESL